MEPYGLDDLETLLKCKKAIQGDMRKVMANNIAQYIKDLLIKENSKHSLFDQYGIFKKGKSNQSFHRQAREASKR
jgi:hypothetical protein